MGFEAYKYLLWGAVDITLHPTILILVEYFVVFVS
jgi:hypothetical protein